METAAKTGPTTFDLRQGASLSWARAFSQDDVLDFARLTGDKGQQHTRGDVLGRLMVHGLLTASLPTKIGGDFNFIAREMNLQFLLPVYTDETVSCQITVKEREEEVKKVKVTLDIVCWNVSGKEVLRGVARGHIMK